MKISESATPEYLNSFIFSNLSINAEWKAH